MKTAKVVKTKKAPKSKKASKARGLVAQAKKAVEDAVVSRVADTRILEMAAAQYSRLLKEVARRKKQLSQEKQMAFELGEKILARAKEVSSSLVKK